MPRILRLAFLYGALVAATLQAQSTLPPGTWRIPDAPVEMREALSRADLLILSLQDALQRELTGALAQGGPAFALQSCHIDVVGTTQRIERLRNVHAGRTSDRLRNPANAPRPWAAALVKANAGRFTRDVPGFAVDLGDTVGVLRPIAHRPMCDSCHGATAQIDPAVRRAVQQRYPADSATGFTTGEIRGWFWVEVPKAGH